MRIVIGEGSCGIAAGAEKVYKALDALRDGFTMGITGCIGMCFLEPIADIYNENGLLLKRLVRLTPEDAPRIAEAVKSGDLDKVKDLEITDEDAGFLRK